MSSDDARRGGDGASTGGRPAEEPAEDAGSADRIRDLLGGGTGMGGGPPRLVVIVLVLATLALGVLVDAMRPEAGTDGGAETEPVLRVFHCPDTPTAENADTEISIASNASEPLAATVDVVSDNPEQATVTVPTEVPPHGTAIVRLSDHSDNAGAVSVTVPAAEVAVAAKVVRRTGAGSVHGVGAYACPDAPAETWRFATGSTAKGVLEFVYVYNPTDDEVVFDAFFKTRNADEPTTRDEAPLGGVTLAPHRRAKISVHEEVIRRDEVAVTVHAQRGKIVVSNALLPGGGANAFGVTAGATSPAKSMLFTGGRSAEGQTDRITLLNETDRIGLVTVLSFPESGSEPIPPKDLEYPAASVSTLDLSGVVDVGPSVANELEADVEAVADQLRTSSNDVALVTPVFETAKVWLLPSSPADPADAFVELANPGDRDVEATLYLLGTEGADSLEALGAPVVVPAGTRVGVDAGDVGVKGGGGLLVTFDGAGAAGQGYFEQGDWAIMSGIPVR